MGKLNLNEFSSLQRYLKTLKDFININIKF